MKIFLSTIGLLLITQGALNAESPKFQTSSGNSHCFKSREMMHPLEETFDALKQTLMQSNLNIVTVTKNDGVLTAKGNQYNPGEDTIIGVTLTVDFKAREKEKTSVKVIASYETIAKKSDTGQIGGAGITLPIPVPFTGKYTLVGQGNINDSTWYRGFFNSLEKILFENHMKYSHIKKVEEPILVKIVEEPKIVPPIVAPIVVPAPSEAVVVTPKEEIKAIEEPKKVEEAKTEEVKPAEPVVETPKTETITETKVEEITQPATNTQN
jgi:hypothetical protein